MTRDRYPRGFLAASCLSIAIALVVAGCGNGAASLEPSIAATAAPVATPAPTPSPSPADVSAAFVKIVSAPGFSAAGKITGTVTFGTVKGEITGDGVFSGTDSSGTTTITAGTLKQSTDSVTIGKKAWSRRDPGPWLEKDAASAASSHSMGDVLTGIASVVDLGVATHAGRALHHLQPKGGNAISAAAIGFDVANATDAKFTLDLYATDDGTPAIMAVTGTWTQGTGTTALPITVAFDLALSDVGKAQTITEPDDVWVRYTSKTLGYTMAHPADWTVESTKGKDSYLLNDQGYVYVATTSFKGSTAKFVTALKASYKTPFKGNPTSETATVLGGKPAVRLVYQFTNDTDQDVTIADDVISLDGTGWEVFLATAGGPEDIDVFDQFVATFTFAK